MASQYYSGVDGRVRVGAGEVVVAGVTKWSLRLAAPVIDATNFESTADASNNVWRELVTASGGGTGPKVGIIAASVDIEGRFNSDGTSGSLANLNVGSAVSLDLVVSKNQPYGFSDLSGVVTEFSITSDIKSTEATAFTAKVELTGVLPGGSTTLT